MAGSLHAGFVPGRHLIDAYGAGGFRFAGMSHQGSILALPSGIKAWNASLPRDLTADAFADVAAEAADIELLLIGTGANHAVLPKEAAAFLISAGLRHEVMSTAAAARTCNVLLAENRRCAAALLAVA